MNDSGLPAQNKVPRWKRILRYIERCFALIGLMFVVYALGFDLTTIVTGSMAPTLEGTSITNGDKVLTEKISYRFRQPRRWEIVTFHNDEGLQIMKRVVGLPGETIALKDKQIFVNDVALTRPSSLDFLRYLPYGNLAGGLSVRCHKGYYVLGDDTQDSYDSRFVGPIQRVQILGRAWLIVWPPSRIRFVTP